MLKRLRRAFGGASDIRTGTKIVLNCEKLEHRIALLEEGVLEEYNVERTADEKIVGSIFKGKVKNIEPGLKAMFVDIGIDKNAFLHFWDAIPAALDSGMEEITRKGRSKKSKKKKKTKKAANAPDTPLNDLSTRTIARSLFTLGAFILVTHTLNTAMTLLTFI